MDGQIFTTKEQEDELVRKIQKGSEQEAERAWLKLFELLHPLLFSVSSHYVGRGLTNEQLIDLGRSGLKQAVNQYHGYDEKYKFSTYATWFIREKIHRKLGIKGEE